MACTRRASIYLTAMNGGGAERTMINLARGLIEGDWQVRFILCCRGGELANDIPGGAEVVELDVRRAFLGLAGLVIDLRRYPADVLISSLERCNLVAALAVFFCRQKPLLILRAPVVLSDYFGGLDLLRRTVFSFLTRRLYPAADRIVAAGEDVAKDLVECFGVPKRMLSIIHNGLPAEEILRRASDPCRHPWLSDPDVPCLLAVGRLAKQKNYATLINAFAILRFERPLRLIILGEGPERRVLQAQAASLGIAADIDMPGFVNNPYCYMRNASVYVLCSHYEGRCNSAHEAALVGVPMVLVRAPGVAARDECWPPHTEIINSAAPESMAVAIGRALSMPKVFRCPLQVDPCVSLDDMVASYVALFEECLTKSTQFS